MNTFESSGDSIQVAALRYARLGLVPIPLRVNEKSACLRGWPTLRSRTLLRQFHNHHGNIGLRLGQQPNGTNLVAVDIDVKSGGNLAVLTQNRSWPTATASAITPSGGTHFLLRFPGNQRIRTRIGLIKGVDLIGERGLIVVEPSSLDGREYVWLQDPASGIAPAPVWLLDDLRKGGLIAKTGPPSPRIARTAQNTSSVPRALRQPLRGTRKPIRKARTLERGPLAEVLARFPVPGPGSRHNQFVRLTCALVCDPRGFSDIVIRDVVLDWWRHWHDQGLCRTPPDARVVDAEIRRTRRSHSRARISTGTGSAYAALRTFLHRPLPFLPYGGLGGREAPKTEPLQLGSAEADFVGTLLVHFAGEALLTHPLDDSYKATNKQLIEKMKWVHGSVIEGKELRELKRKFITKEWSGEMATKLELLICTREGYRTTDEQVPSLYKLTHNLMELLDSYYSMAV